MTMQEPTLNLRGAKSRKKANNFERLNIDVERTYEMIAIDDLRIPNESHEYQRDESEGRIAKEIAMHFDDVAFGVLTVIQRTDGSLVVADGGTRLSAARLRGDIPEVPCMVSHGLTNKQEADTFLRINMNRRKLRTEQQQKSEFYAGHKLAVVVENIRNAFMQDRVGFEGLRLLRTCLQKEPQATDIVVKILRTVAMDRHVSVKIFKGLVYLEALLKKNEQTLDRKPVVRRLQQNFGLLDAAINATLKPRSPGDQATCARAIARTIKIKLPKMED